jgi:hypothetical protein
LAWLERALADPTLADSALVHVEGPKVCYILLYYVYL